MTAERKLTVAFAIGLLATVHWGCGSFPTERQFERIADTAQGLLAASNPFMFIIAAGSIAERIICPTWRVASPAEAEKAKAKAEKEINSRPSILDGPPMAIPAARPLTPEDREFIEDWIDHLPPVPGAVRSPLRLFRNVPPPEPPRPAEPIRPPVTHEAVIRDTRPPATWSQPIVMVEFRGQWVPQGEPQP